MIWRRLTSKYFLVLTGIILLFPCYHYSQDKKDIFDLSMKDLMEVKITSASNRAEKLYEAPATVIVITREEIAERGYLTTHDILTDLPGIDNVFSGGDQYTRSYWRGYRNNLGDPYLLLIDGVVFNHLWFNSVAAVATVPVSSIDRVEFVYGPSSSVYGANAFTGVINIITRKDIKSSGTEITGSITAQDNKRYIGDLNLMYKKGKLRFSLSAHFETGNLKHDNIHNRFEYSKDKYYADRKLWGGFVDNPQIAGGFNSPVEHRGVDLRGYFGNSELGLQFYSVDSGYGFNFSADRALSNSIWILQEKSIYLRHSEKISDKILSKTMVRYRESGVPEYSDFVLRNSDGGISYSYWPVHNHSWSLNQDFEICLLKKHAITTGIKFERKDLQKAYREIYGPYILPGDLDSATYPYPSIPTQYHENFNRLQVDEKSFYIHSKFTISETHHLHLGFRVDDHTKYGTNFTFRGAYVAKFNDFVAKVLFGEAYYPPSQRLLYGGWTGAGSDPKLDPEKSSTLEVNFSHTTDKVSNYISFYYVKNRNTVITLAGGAKNIGERKIYGLDYHFKAQLKPSFLKKLKLWVYYSFIGGKGDELHSDGTMRWAEVGDMANHKFWIGATALFDSKLSANLRGRFIGRRDTVQTNPVRYIKSYFIADMNLRYQITEKLGISLKITNLFDGVYFHPGIRNASSGEEPGYWDGDQWNGSKGWYMSKVPQPGRTISLSLHIGR